MLAFDGFNPNHIPQAYIEWGWRLFLISLLIYQLKSVVREFVIARKNWKEARRIRKERIQIEERLKAQEEEDRLLNGLGFRKPTIVRWNANLNTHECISFSARDSKVR